MNDGIVSRVSGAGLGLQMPAPGQKSGGTGFGELLKKSIEAVSEQGAMAEQAETGLLQGEHANIHETMIAMEEASISFRLLTKVQGKVLNAYQEIMRLQL